MVKKIRYFLENHDKIVKVAILSIYIVIVSVLIFIGLIEIKSRLDFRAVYNASMLVYRTWNFELIYDYQLVKNMEFYRYFPFFTILFMPLIFLGESSAYLCLSIISIIASIFIVIEMNRFIQSRCKNPHVFMIYFLINFITFGAYVMGNIVLISLLFVMLSLKFSIQGREKPSAFLLGISIIIKPIAIFTILIYIFSFLFSRQIKRMLVFMIFLLLPMIPDILLFTTNPRLIHAFINSSASIDLRSTWYSISAASFTYYAFSISFVVFSAIVFPIFLHRIKPILVDGKPHKEIAIFGFGALFHFIFLIDIWFTQFAILLPFLILNYLMNPRIKWFIIKVLALQVVAQIIAMDVAFVSIPLQLLILILWFWIFIDSSNKLRQCNGKKTGNPIHEQGDGQDGNEIQDLYALM